MPLYPVLPTVTKSIKRHRQSLPQHDVADDGTLRSQNLAAVQTFEIELEHPLIFATDVETLDDFHAANVNTVVTTPALSDGHTYDCLLVSGPEVEDVNAIRKTVKQRLIGTRN